MRPLQITVLISLLLALAAGFLSLNAAARAGRAEAALEETRLELTAALDQVRELLEQKAPAVAPPAERPRPLASPRGAREALAAAVPTAAPPAASPRPEESRPEILDRIGELEGRALERALEELAELARAGEEAALAAILSNLSHGDPGVREEAIEALGEIGDPALIGHLEAALQDPDGDVRQEVADALRNMPADLAGPILADMLADPDEGVLQETLQSLGRLRYAPAAAPVAELIQGDDLDLVALAGSTLRRMDQGDLSSLALERLSYDLSSADALDRINAVQRIRRMGGREAAEVLERVVAQDGNVSVRLEAQRALERLR